MLVSHLKPRAVWAALLFLFAMTIVPVEHALAGDAADFTREALTKGDWNAAEQELSRRLDADPGNDEARFGLAMVRFVRSIEKFGQHHYHYGLAPPKETGVPFLRLPVPANTKPDLLTYEIQRAALQTLLDDLTGVETTLAGIRDKDVKIVIDLEKVRLDFAPGTPSAVPPTLMRVVRAINPVLQRRQPAGNAAESFEIAFDKGDALWLRGYCHLLSAGLEFVLAHDWRETFETTGALFYPRLAQKNRSLYESRVLYSHIAEFIAALHLIRWEPVEPARLKNVREHLKQVVALSRQSWKAIFAETDDDREWLPSPRQMNAVLPRMQITEERVRTWLAALDDFDAVLDGRLLIPHWRLKTNGVNLRRVLEEPRTFDLVLWSTGHAAIPYLEDGPLLQDEKVRIWQRVFSGDFLLFAIYFN